MPVNRRFVLCLGVAVVTSGSGWDQAFEVVSVKPSQSAGGMTITSDPGRLTLRNVTLKFCIEAAYRVKEYQVSGGPVWVTTETYDIDAKATRPSTGGELYAMLQPVLADRFNLTLHRETKDVQGYALVTAKSGQRLQRSGSAGEGEMRVGRDHLMARKVSLNRFSEALSNLLDCPVMDMTGLSEMYDIDLKWAPDERQTVSKPGVPPSPATSGGDASGPSIFSAVQEQLGLKLEVRKSMIQILVIDHVEKPAAN